MNDIIKKAVELADGWSAGEVHGFLDEDGGGLIFPLDEMPQHALDALAAQLVRQCLTQGFHVVCGFWSDIAVWKDGDFSKSVYEITEHQDIDRNDRTMNTIKAIVDSGVLEN